MSLPLSLQQPQSQQNLQLLQQQQQGAQQGGGVAELLPLVLQLTNLEQVRRSGKGDEPVDGLMGPEGKESVWTWTVAAFLVLLQP